jgi:hypothetical protein
MPAQERYLPCPRCREFIHPSAQVCPRCAQPCVGVSGASPEELARVEAALDALASQADVPATVAGQPGRFRVITWILIALAVPLCAAFRVEPVLITLMPLGVVAFVVGLILFFADVDQPSPRGRRTEWDAARCYLRAAARGRFRIAHACLAHTARRREVEPPRVPELEVDAAPAAFATPHGLRAYWRAFTAPARGFGLYRRVAQLHILQVDAVRPNVAVAWADLTVEYYPSVALLGLLLGLIPGLVLIMVLRDTRALRFPLALVKHRSQWWVVTGEAYGQIDAAVLTHSP